MTKSEYDFRTNDSIAKNGNEDNDDDYENLNRDSEDRLLIANLDNEGYDSEQ